MTKNANGGLIICAAVTGGAPPKSRSPFHPTTMDDIADEAVESWRAGAAIIHLHARDPEGTPILSVEAYEELAQEIRFRECDAVLNVSAGDNGGRADHSTRLSIADTSVEMVSLDIGSFNISGRLYNNAPDYTEELSRRLKDSKVRPEIEIFDTGHLQEVNRMAEMGLLEAPYYIQFVFGVPGGMRADPLLLERLVELLPEETHWCVSCQTTDPIVYRRIMLATFAMGGHVRTGMEDIVHLSPGVLARSNAEFVKQWVETAAAWGRPVLSAEEAREVLALRGSIATAETVRQNAGTV
ncbi:MAG: 3-keto-5-aminohexanoate cleavage protein [Alphaproteobacteria bacterium]